MAKLFNKFFKGSSGKGIKKDRKYPYRVSDNNFEADASASCSKDDLYRLFNEPSFSNPRMEATTYALSENRNVTILQSGTGFMFFYNERVDHLAKYGGSSTRIEDFLKERPELGEGVIAVTADIETFTSLLHGDNGLDGHPEVAEHILENYKENKYLNPVTINQVEETLGIYNLGEISSAYTHGSVVFMREAKSNEYYANQQICQNEEGKGSLENASFQIGGLSDDIDEPTM